MRLIFFICGSTAVIVNLWTSLEQKLLRQCTVLIEKIECKTAGRCLFNTIVGVSSMEKNHFNFFFCFSLSFIESRMDGRVVCSEIGLSLCVVGIPSKHWAEPIDAYNGRMDNLWKYFRIWIIKIMGYRLPPMCTLQWKKKNLFCDSIDSCSIFLFWLAKYDSRMDAISSICEIMNVIQSETRNVEFRIRNSNSQQSGDLNLTVTIFEFLCSNVQTTEIYEKYSTMEMFRFFVVLCCRFGFQSAFWFISG